MNFKPYTCSVPLSSPTNSAMAYGTLWTLLMCTYLSTSWSQGIMDGHQPSVRAFIALPGTVARNVGVVYFLLETGTLMANPCQDERQKWCLHHGPGELWNVMEECSLETHLLLPISSSLSMLPSIMHCPSHTKGEDMSVHIHVSKCYLVVHRSAQVCRVFLECPNKHME